MSRPERFERLPLTRHSKWVTYHREYYRDMLYLLEDLQTYQAQVEAALAPEVGEMFLAREFPEASRISKRRNATMRSVIVFAAMTAEATVNYYGARRFGGRLYAEHFERIPFVKKVRRLMFEGEDIQIEEGDLLLTATRRISTMRNDLVHPKVEEVSLDEETGSRMGHPVIPTAEAAVEACNDFLDIFCAYLPPWSRVDPRSA